MSVMAKTKELQMHRKWKNREISPERTKVWTEPHSRKLNKVPVLYYISRNGQLEHPHFIEVPLSSPDGLYLRDVINRLNILRGKGMASMYSWSAKRSYRNGFVWQDLTENDFIYPAHGQEYVLKGSELLDGSLPSNSDEIETTNSKNPPPEVRKISEDEEFPVIPRRRNQSWSSSDFNEYRVYKAESNSELIGKDSGCSAEHTESKNYTPYIDASTQTYDHRRRRRAMRIVEEEENAEPDEVEQSENGSTELTRGEISPPPSDSSPETLETLMKVDKRVILRPETINEDRTANIQSSGKSKKTSVLMQLLTCGSISFKCGPGYGSLISQYKNRLPRGTGSNQVEKDVVSPMVEHSKIQLEDQEYFSGSLIEMKKETVPALKRSSSYNVERSSKLELISEKERSKNKMEIDQKAKESIA